MKRRDFLATSTAIGLAAAGAGCASRKRLAHEEAGAGGFPRHNGPGYDIHPFIKAHPDAVFVVRTDIGHKKAAEPIRREGEKLAREIIVPVEKNGIPTSALVNVKHNWHGIQKSDDLIPENTDSNFTEGWIQGMMAAGPRRFYVNRAHEMQTLFRQLDLYGLASLHDVNLEDYNRNPLELTPEQVEYLKIPDGMVFEHMAHYAPFNDTGAFLVNIAKLKAHSMGITCCVKNLQGLCPGFFRGFCTPHDSLREKAGEDFGRYLRTTFERDIEREYARHVREGIPRWEMPKQGYGGGIWMEQWCQRMMDSFSVTPRALHVVEGINAMDGNGFGAGPHEKTADGYTCRDYMANVLMFGMDPFRVDIIAHLMCGHEPGNFGLFHIGIERGFSKVLDPADIPVYMWEDGAARKVTLDSLPRTPLRTLYLQREGEPRYHLCDEPFDYSAWKKGERSARLSPTIDYLGRDDRGRSVLDISLPERDEVYVDVVDSSGRLQWRLIADGILEPGHHQVVWDGFDHPGLYSAYFHGMGWDARRQVVIPPAGTRTA